MSLQRLKFAWARGARIQSQWHNGNPQSAWLDTPHVTEDCRIHPDDAHLEYGPLSKGLIEDVIYDDTPREPLAQAAIYACIGLYGEECWPELLVNEPDGIVREFYWLFIAELLADEGL